ncbi:MAG: flavodoxin [Oscillospiraceae bacterium]|nr:flavodoxin [Oscillospiraceae bacterium]MBQ3049541.1 flavodoxin [Oscillospiraceae bacterium]MBQ9937930.1 flavodoxin [Oscillospiraceae bacterium]
MNIAVRYYTRSGNTKKLADAVASAIAVEAKEVASPLTEKADILFLGCSYYAFDADAEVKRFITENKDNIGKIVCFGTSAMMRSMKKPIKKVADAVGVAVADEEFHCRGEFAKFHKGRPNEADIAEISEFAKNIVNK